MGGTGGQMTSTALQGQPSNSLFDGKASYPQSRDEGCGGKRRREILGCGLSLVERPVTSAEGPVAQGLVS